MFDWLPVILRDDLVGFAFALLTALVIYLFRSRVKLIYGRANNSRNVIFHAQAKEQEHTSTEIYVEKFYLQNAGRATANRVEFVLSSKPSDISVFPPTTLEYKIVEKGEWHMLIPQIAPGELVIIDCLYINQPASWISSVKCAEGVGQVVHFWTLRRYGPWATWLAGTLMLLGLAFIVNLLLQVLRLV